MKKITAATAAAVLLILLANSVFMIHETEQAVVTRLGRPVRVIQGGLFDEVGKKAFREVVRTGKEMEIPYVFGAGLYFKQPFIESVVKYENRILEYDSLPTDVVTADKKHLLVDNYAEWRIKDPLKFLQTVRTESGAQTRLDDIVYSVLREELARNSLIEIVRTSNRPSFKRQIKNGRARIMQKVTEQCNHLAQEYGIEVIDVRIKRADLPTENMRAVFERMKAERERISKQFRSEGQEEAEKIKAETDRDVTILLAEARKEAEIIHGKADAEATRIYAEAYSQNEEFYLFMRSLEAIEKTISKKNTSIIISTGSTLYEYLKHERVMETQ